MPMTYRRKFFSWLFVRRYIMHFVATAHTQRTHTQHQCGGKCSVLPARTQTLYKANNISFSPSLSLTHSLTHPLVVVSATIYVIHAKSYYGIGAKYLRCYGIAIRCYTYFFLFFFLFHSPRQNFMKKYTKVCTRLSLSRYPSCVFVCVCMHACVSPHHVFEDRRINKKYFLQIFKNFVIFFENSFQYVSVEKRVNKFKVQLCICGNI